MLARYAAVSPASGPLGWPLFRRCTALSAARSSLWRKRGTRKSRLETKTKNEARSALLARLWCHLPLQNPANRAENLTRLCSATIGQTGWRMVQSGAIRSRQEIAFLLEEILDLGPSELFPPRAVVPTSDGEPSVDTSNPKRPGARVLSSFVLLDTTQLRQSSTSEQ